MVAPCKGFGMLHRGLGNTIRLNDEGGFDREETLLLAEPAVDVRHERRPSNGILHVMVVAESTSRRLRPGLASRELP